MNKGKSTKAPTKVALMKAGADEVYSFPLFVPDDDQLSAQIPAVVFLMNEQPVADPAETGMSGCSMVKKSFSALKKNKPAWQKVFGHRGELQYLCLQVKEGTIAEKILDESCMAAAAKMSGCETLAIQIPNEQMLMATPYEGHSTLPYEFLKRGGKEFNYLGAAPLSNLIFLYQSGRIVDAFDRKDIAPEKNEDHMNIVLHEEQTLHIDEVDVFTGDFFYRARVSAADDISLMDLVERTIYHLLICNLGSHNFLGVIEFIIDGRKNPYSLHFDKKLNRLWDCFVVSERMNDLVRMLDLSVELSFVFESRSAGHSEHPRKHFKIGARD